MSMYKRNARQAMFSALYRLLQIKDIDSISVEEIIKLARISRSTFYRAFRDKYELLQWSHEYLIYSTFSLGPDHMGWREMCVNALCMYRSHAVFYRNALRSDDPNALRHDIREVDLAYYRALLTAAGIDPADSRNARMLDVFLLGATEVLAQWIENGCVQEPEELADVFQGAFPRAFASCLDLPATSWEISE